LKSEISYVANIGLEVHVQLKTRSKMFCACPVEVGAAPNTHTCPVCLGLPGGLPVVNHQALRMGVMMGLMLDCEIAEVSQFDRKNYFYPDLAKNYQISQYDLPLCRSGRVPLYELAYPTDAQKSVQNPDREIGLVRVHLEEDVAKSVHSETTTGIDFNRAGTPLMEIVSEPEINSPEEAFAFLTSLRQILSYAGISDADMEKGQLRCDCNVSVRATADAALGVKVEIKNMNSLSGVRRALAYEIERQTRALGKGETLEQETRGWDDARGQSFLLRTKEAAHDYRYFPEPDLVPVRTDKLTAEARSRIPESPKAKRDRLVREYQISAYDAAVLAANIDLAAYFESAARGSDKPKQIANWILNDLQSALASAGKSITNCGLPAAALAELVDLIDQGRISGRQGKDVFLEMFATGQSAGAIVNEKGVEQLSDAAVIERLCKQAIAANPKPASDFRSGNAAALNFLTGEVIKLSQGKANPQLVREILQRKLREQSD
jgi:aspartyl-tRNA(Asn)/glutamyl-tRNA(Gln) amidotransferase subunit B